MANEKTLKEKWQSRIIRNEMILQSLAEGICLIDLENRISFANPSASKMLGWQMDKLLGQRYEIIFGQEQNFAPTADENFISPIQFAIIEGETIHVNTETFYRQDKTDFLVEYICVPLYEDGLVVAAVITFQDITERRDLENAVDQARQAALEATRTKANFLANMSHEIRTPLNGIIGITELLALTALSKEQTNYIETLKTSAHLLLEIVNDILDFSKLEASKLELEAIDFDLPKIIAEILQLFTPEAVNKRIQLKYEIAKEIVPRLRGDAGRLRQILNNLISNAIKFTQDGEVSIKTVQSGEGILRFEISDTGIGIEKDKQVKIFEPFIQGDISTTRQFGGTGLGLAISKELVQMMGGEIGVESEIGKGTTFWFTAKFTQQWGSEGVLPADLNQPNEEISAHQKEEIIKILVVEDNQINQEVALGRLRQLGIKADVAQNGLAALQAVRSKKYDLILMDCRMPEMDGLEATRQIRQINGHSIKIIAMTASVTPGERANCLAAGMDDYLAKPMTMEALAETLNHHFRDKISLPALKAEVNIHHPLAKIIEAKILENFLEIEARGEKDFVKEMLGIYLNHTETQLIELQNAFFAQNRELVKNKAHSLKGSSGNIGVINLFQDFGSLEEEAGKEEWVNIKKIIDKILQEFTTLKAKVSHLTEFGD